MILLVDKPVGITSAAVISHIKKAFNQKIHVGHTGTLDPLCSGLLPVLIGNDTKLTQFLPHKKSYEAVLRLGIKTDSGDITGNVLSTSNSFHSSLFSQVISNFIGEISQIPPMYSAVHFNGRRLYEIAREGKTVEVPPRKITIYSISLIRYLNDSDVLFSITCSAGTYIRTLCEDIATAMGTIGTMKSLRRTESNGFSVQQALPMQEWEEKISTGQYSDFVLDAETALSDYSACSLPENGLKYYMNGGALASDRILGIMQKNAYYRAYFNKKFIGLLYCDNDNFCKSVFHVG